MNFVRSWQPSACLPAVLLGGSAWLGRNRILNYLSNKSFFTEL
jgi:hypothetical protein